MAATGRSNREVADALGLSVRTVNSHLNHTYAKLGTSDRDDLAVRLRGSGRARPGGGSDDGPR